MAHKIKSDADAVEQIKAYLDANKFSTRAELTKKLRISAARLEKLSIEYGFTLPPKLNKSLGATLNRRRNNVMDGWYIKKPTVNESRIGNP